MTPFYLEPLYCAFVALVAVAGWAAGFLWSESEIAALQEQVAITILRHAEEVAKRANAIIDLGNEITANSRLRVEVARLEAQLKEQETV